MDRRKILDMLASEFNQTRGAGPLSSVNKTQQRNVRYVLDNKPSSLRKAIVAAKQTKTIETWLQAAISVDEHDTPDERRAIEAYVAVLKEELTARAQGSHISATRVKELLDSRPASPPRTPPPSTPTQSGTPQQVPPAPSTTQGTTSTDPSAPMTLTPRPATGRSSLSAKHANRMVLLRRKRFPELVDEINAITKKSTIDRDVATMEKWLQTPQGDAIGQATARGYMALLEQAQRKRVIDTKLDVSDAQTVYDDFIKPLDSSATPKPPTPPPKPPTPPPPKPPTPPPKPRTPPPPPPPKPRSPTPPPPKPRTPPPPPLPPPVKPSLEERIDELFEAYMDDDADVVVRLGANIPSDERKDMITLLKKHLKDEDDAKRAEKIQRLIYIIRAAGRPDWGVEKYKQMRAQSAHTPSDPTVPPSPPAPVQPTVTPAIPPTMKPVDTTPPVTAETRKERNRVQNYGKHLKFIEELNDFSEIDTEPSQKRKYQLIRSREEMIRSLLRRYGSYFKTDMRKNKYNEAERKELLARTQRLMAEFAGRYTASTDAAPVLVQQLFGTDVALDNRDIMNIQKAIDANKAKLDVYSDYVAQRLTDVKAPNFTEARAILATTQDKRIKQAVDAINDLKAQEKDLLRLKGLKPTADVMSTVKVRSYIGDSKEVIPRKRKFKRVPILPKSPYKIVVKKA